MELNGNSKLSELVISDYRASHVLDKYNIDFFNKGSRTLLEACEHTNSDLEKIISELRKAMSGNNEGPDFDKYDICSLIKYISDIHHEYIKNNFPVICTLSKEVRNSQKTTSPESVKLAELYENLKKELDIHIQKEERMIFPYISELLKKKKFSLTYEVPPFGSIVNLIEVMEKEHNKTADIMYKMRETGNNYIPPENANMTAKVLYKELKYFEKDLIQHIHLENNILFPKGIALEEKIKKQVIVNK
jgi:regulator of cell morphogenesis and NO signaling